MFLKRGKKDRSALPVICWACGLGLLIFFSRLGEPSSFDLPFRFWSPATPDEAVLVTMDDTTYDDAGLNAKYDYPDFDRSTHARFLEKLTADGARLVVFDIFFKDTMPEDDAMASAIKKHGNVILVAEKEKLGNPEFPGFRTNDPTAAFLDLPGCKIALPDLLEGVVRKFTPENEYRRTLPFTAAAQYGHPVEPYPPSVRWVAYYGNEGTLPSETYETAMNRPAGYFNQKVVFIGGKPRIGHVSDKKDHFPTPHSRWADNEMPGVEILATMFLNLIRTEFLTEVATGKQILLILLTGILFGWIVTLFRPLPGLIVVFIGAISVSVIAIVIFWTQRIWFNWVLIGWLEIPVAWATSALLYSRHLFREKETLQKELESIRSERRASPRPPVSPGGVLADMQPVAAQDAPVTIQNFELLREIGEGAYGQVWLARNLVGTYRAIKIVFRRNFSEQRPFEREFEGVRNFEPISGTHPGWVSILHVGKDDSNGFFYYVMDPADDLILGPNIDPNQYTPKTLGKLLVDQEYLPVLECVDLGIHLADALGALHGHNLIHRDVKPSNIIFANNKPRLADIGLVAQPGGPSIVGTEGFIPLEGPGSTQADIFSLGRVLYQAATGCAPDRHPELPTSLGQRSDARDLMRLMEIINKACARFHGDRYITATELHDDLVRLRIRLVDARL